MKSIRILLQKHEYLNTYFMDLFSKTLIDNRDPSLTSAFGYETVPYSEFIDYLRKKKVVSHKRQGEGNECSYNFLFESMENNVTFMLDVSPYMVNYNYGTNSLSLASLQLLVRHLLGSLLQRAKDNSEFNYRVSIYLFSVYGDSPQLLIDNVKIMSNTVDYLIEFVTEAVSKFKLPDETQKQPKKLIGEAIQLILNREEEQIGHKAFIVISSFQYDEPSSILLLSPYWYVFTLVTTGGHFGSYRIDEQQVLDKFITGTFFKTKHMFRPIFLENWQKTDLLRANPNCSIIKSSTEKYRSIVFYSPSGDLLLTDIWNYNLMLYVTVGKQKCEVSTFLYSASCLSVKQYKRVVHRRYTVPYMCFNYVLQTRYLQGWEPMFLDSTHRIDNSKFKFRLLISSNRYLYYQADRKKDRFLIEIYQRVGYTENYQGIVTEKQINDCMEISKILYRYDVINSSDFGTVGLVVYRHSRINLDSYRSDTLLQQLISHKEYWGKYFKIKRMCFKFEPGISPQVFEHFTGELSCLFGKRIGKFIFLKRTYAYTGLTSQQAPASVQLRQVNLRIAVNKLTILDNLLYMKLAFLRYSHKEIQTMLYTISSRLGGIKLKEGAVEIVPHQIIVYHRDPVKASQRFLTKRWAIRFSRAEYRRCYEYHMQYLYRLRRFHLLKGNVLQHYRHLFQVIYVVTYDDTKLYKVVYLTISYNEYQYNEIVYRMSIAPCMRKFVCLKCDQTQHSFKMLYLLQLMVAELQYEQTYVMNILDSYRIIHEKLFRKVLNEGTFHRRNCQLEMMFKDKHDKQGRTAKDHEMLFKTIVNYYPVSSEKLLKKELVHSIPYPKQLLMETELDDVEGDLRLNIANKFYTFFLYEPSRPVYICQYGSRIFYKMISPLLDLAQRGYDDQRMVTLSIEAIKYTIKKQYYRKMYSKLFVSYDKTANLSGILLRRPENKSSFEIDLSELMQIVITNENIEPVVFMFRVQKKIVEFGYHYFNEIYKYFSIRRVNYYFQRRNEDENEFNYIIMQNSLKIGYENIEINYDNIVNLLLEHKHNLVTRRTMLVVEYYQTLTECYILEHPVMKLLESRLKILVREAVYEMEQYSIVRREDLIVRFRELSCFEKDASETKLCLDLIRCVGDGQLCEYIEGVDMQLKMALKSVNRLTRYFVIYNELPSQMIHLYGPFFLRVQDGVLYFQYPNREFYVGKYVEWKNKMEGFASYLANFANANILFAYLTFTYELPLYPNYLFLSDAVNSKYNKILDRKKKPPKISLSKRLYKLLPYSKRGPSKIDKKYDIASRKVYLSLIFRNCISIHYRCQARDSLQAIKDYQIFQVASILNLKHTYLIMRSRSGDLVLHFEYIYHYKIIQYMYDIKIDIIQRAKRYLVYSVHGLHSQLKRSYIYKEILPHIKYAIMQKVFHIECQYLLSHPALILEPYYNFLKGDKRMFLFDLPDLRSIVNQDIIMSYLRHFIQMYHEPTRIKSDLDRKVDLYDYLSLRSVESGITINTNYLMLDKSIKCSRSTSNSIKGFINCKIKQEDSYTFSYIQNNDLWLFNCERSVKYEECYGKCLYLLKIYCVETDRNSDYYLSIDSKSYLTMLERLRTYLLAKRKTKSKKDSPINKINVVFNIVYCVGSPKYVAIEDTYFYLLKSSLACYYIYEYLYSKLKESIYSNTKKYCYQYNLFETVSTAALDLTDYMDSLIDQADSELFFSVKCESYMLIRDLQVYFLCWLKMLLSTLRKHCKVYIEELPAFLYCYLSTQAYCYWPIKDITLLEEYLTHTTAGKYVIRFGLVFFDDLNQWYNIRKGCSYSKVFSEYTFYDLLKYLKVFYYGQYHGYCLKHSLYFHCEISYKMMWFHSFNARKQFNVYVRDYLLAVENWLSYKYRLLQFIRNAKEGKYDKIVIVKQVYLKSSHLHDSVDMLYESEEGNKETKYSAMNYSDSCLLIDLVFKDLPQHYSTGKLINFSNRWYNIYGALQGHKVDYKKYPEYKGKYKAILYRLGREYLSLLKEYYGFTRYKGYV